MAKPTSPGGSLADLPLSERVSALITLSQRFGRVFPCYGVAMFDGSWACECGQPACKHRVGKQSHIIRWRTRATKDPKQIARWAKQWPLADWSAVTGEDIDVVDLDSKPGKPSGIVTLACWEDCDSVSTPDSVRVSTGLGRHLYFATGGGLKTTSNPSIGIDVRSAGGYILLPGSRHANGNVYEITLDEGLEPCPAWLVERISGKSAPQQNRQDSIKSNNTYSQGGTGGVEGAQRFEILHDAELSTEQWARINELRSKLPKFASTWSAARATSPWPFAQGRNSTSEYEASIAFFLVWDGWGEQSAMNAICVWRRLCGLEAPTPYCRYAITLGKATTLVTPRAKGSSAPRREIKGCWKVGYTRDQILGCIIETPRKPKEIAAVTGIAPVHVRVVLRRLASDGMVIRDNHTYLCAPTAVPWYLQNIPEDAGEATGEELAVEYAEWVAAGMPGLDTVEEEIEAPMMATRPAAASRMATLPNFDDLELEPELVTVEPALRVAELTWSSDRPGGRRTHYTMAALKREAKAKRLA